MTTRSIVVIGHVDHGKTSLVRALTGIETDRLAEEKERGLSIALGFAHRAYDAGTIDFIDAPGHEDFIQAMVSGATGAHSALVVISLDEGIGAQTLEHLHIAGLLGLSNGVIALTKSDMVEPEDQAARLDAIRTALAGTAFGAAELVVCSAHTGVGLEALHRALQNTLSHPAPISGPQESFLPIDRAFTMTGHGTVVTGTLLGQALDLNAEAVLLPSGLRTSVRGLQSRGTKRQTVQAGARIAVNLRGLAPKDISRGDVLCVGKAFKPSNCFDVEISLADLTEPLKHAHDIRVMFGTSNETASIRLYGASKLGAGQSGFAQLRFKKPVTGFAGQACVLRRLSPPQTIGGATILDPFAPPARPSDADRLAVLKAAKAGDCTALGQALSKSQRGVASLSDVARLSRETVAATQMALADSFECLSPEEIAPKDALEAARTAILAALEAYHRRHPLHISAPRSAAAPPLHPILAQYVVSNLCAQGSIRAQGQQIALCSHDPLHNLTPDQRARMDEIAQIYQLAGLSPPTREAAAHSPLEHDLAAILLHQGTLVVLENVALKQTLMFHRDTLNEALLRLQGSFPKPVPFSTSEARSALNTSRRVIVPVLEYFDEKGLTTRKGDTRHFTTSITVSPTSAL